jgi:NodT family efflux transporter outer membrane factor (OMF) lipoprotein
MKTMSTEMKLRSTSLLGILLVSTLAGCAMIPKERFPEAKVPELNKLEASLSNKAIDIQKNWWVNLGDANLNALVEKSLKASPSLGDADARMQSAKALFDANRAVLIPQIGVNGQVTRAKLSQNFIYIPGITPQIVDYGSITGSLQWSLDIWGKQIHKMQAAGKQFEGAQAALEAAKLQLATTIVGVYVDYDRATKSLDLAKVDATVRENLLVIATERRRAGLIDDSTVDVRRIDNELAKVKVGQATLAVKQLQHQLAVLAGEGPSWGEQLPAPKLDESKVVNNFPDKIPADLLARRADLQAMLSQIDAAHLDLTASKLDYLPNIDLRANIGYQSFGLERLLKGPSQMWDIGPVVSLPIFDGGRIDANISAKEANRNQAVTDYHQALLMSLKDAADGIDGFNNAKRDLDHLSRATRSMQNIFEANVQRKAGGIVSQEQLDVIQTNLVRQEQSYVDGRARLLEAHVMLIQALGGSYIIDKQQSKTQEVVAASK